MHNVDGRWYLYFSSSVCNEDWGIVLPSLRVYVLGGGTENPLSGDYEMLGPIIPPNFDHGMLDAVSIRHAWSSRNMHGTSLTHARTELVRH